MLTTRMVCSALGCAVLLSLTAVAVVTPDSVLAHSKIPAVREIVRIRGAVVAGEAACAQGLIALRVLGRMVRLCNSDVRRIAAATAEIAADEAIPDAFDLQGEREQLSIVTAATDGQRVTVLGEWRPGRRDVFLMDVDVCPCEAPKTAE